jgi:uncharacterized protein (DUF885 family)
LAEAGRDLDALEREVVDSVFSLQPVYAVFLGVHEYDGQLPDFRPSATSAWIARAHYLTDRLRNLSTGPLTPDRRFDRTLLELSIESALFDLEEIHELERNPMSYLGQVSLTPYLVRDYAPTPTRIAAMTRLLNAVPAFLENGLRRLEHPLPTAYVQLALTIADGLPAHLREAQAFTDASNGTDARSFSRAREEAETAIGRFASTLRESFLPHATPEFALGPQRYQRLLWVREGIRTPYGEILSQGWEDLRRNQARLEEIARSRTPPMTVSELLESMFRRHVRADDLIPRAQTLVSEVRAFVEEHSLVTIPPEAVCRVEETPSYGRALSTASMNPPGPFDRGSADGIYYVTPVDRAWSPEHQEEWLRLFNDATLRNTTVHEVFPGHYVQFLHFRAASTSLARKAYISSAFTEGWAHYSEQMAVEAGLATQDADAEVAQLHDALLRDCRLISSIGLHTQGMTVPAAAEVFRREAFLEELPAHREAMRGTFNPEYFCYTLGKLAILDARRRTLDRRFGGALGAFHGRLLSFGAPPVGFLVSLLDSDETGPLSARG